MRKWDMVSDEELYTVITYIQEEFDPDLALKVIELFYERMRDDIDVNPILLSAFTQHAFAQILDGKTADQAFGLKQIKGKYKRLDTESRDIGASLLVTKYRRCAQFNKEDAINETSDLLQLSSTAVSRAYTEYRTFTDHLPCINLDTLILTFTDNVELSQLIPTTKPDRRAKLGRPA